MTAQRSDASDTPARLGRAAGLDPAQSACDCPFGHDRLPARERWMAGFGEGRAVLNPRGLAVLGSKLTKA